MSAAPEVPLYDQFGERYDLMVDWSGRIARELPFLQRVFREARTRRILDLGCATGHHAARFAQLGYEVVGADPSGELIRLARAHFGSTAGLSFVQAGLGQLRGAVDGTFDVVTCLGNTLPHLPDRAALRASFEDISAVLSEGGCFVAQLLNYDRILAERRRFLGVGSRRVEEREYVFFRFYDYPDSPSGESLVFNLATFERSADGEWSFRVDSTRLLPITSRQITSAVLTAGMTLAETAGGYAGEPFDASESNDLVFVARR